MAKSRSSKPPAGKAPSRGPSRDPMICSPCGIPMNHHAEKLVDPTSPAEAKRMDPALRGLILETHCCPGCGSAATRPGS